MSNTDRIDTLFRIANHHNKAFNLDFDRAERQDKRIEALADRVTELENAPSFKDAPLSQQDILTPLLEESLRTGRRVRFSYRDLKGEPTYREVSVIAIHPISFVGHDAQRNFAYRQFAKERVTFPDLAK